MNHYLLAVGIVLKACIRFIWNFVAFAFWLASLPFAAILGVGLRSSIAIPGELMILAFCIWAYSARRDFFDCMEIDTDPKHGELIAVNALLSIVFFIISIGLAATGGDYRRDFTHHFHYYWHPFPQSPQAWCLGFVIYLVVIGSIVNPKLLKLIVTPQPRYGSGWIASVVFWMTAGLIMGSRFLINPFALAFVPPALMILGVILIAAADLKCRRTCQA